MVYRVVEAVVVYVARMVMYVAASFLGWWLLTGPGGMSVTPWLFGVVALAVVSVMETVDRLAKS